MQRTLAFVLSGLFALAFCGQALAAAGYVHDLKGSATARTGAAAATRPLRIGDQIDRGQTVATGAGSNVVIKFEDGQVIALNATSSFTIQEYSYNKKNVSASNAAFALLRGGLRFITGVIGSTNRGAVRVTAASATIGIRGTDGTVLIDPVTAIVTAAVAAGAIAMATPEGVQTVGVGSFSSYTPGNAPSIPAPTAQATAAVQQTLNTLSQLQNIPINTPVVVEASAKAAAAKAAADANPSDTALQAAAQAALADAVKAAQQALQDAINAGATPPAPPAPPGPAPGTTPPPDATPPPTEPTGTTTPTGMGAGGGGTASPN